MVFEFHFRSAPILRGVAFPLVLLSCRIVEQSDFQREMYRAPQ